MLDEVVATRATARGEGSMTITPSQPAAISATGLRKSFGDKVVLDGIDLDVPEGTVFALLGPNGAGKSTTVHILSTLIGADGGQVRVGGHDVAGDPDAVRAAIGVTGQFSAVDKLLTGEENLVLMANLRHLGRREGRRRAAELLERFDLAEAGRKPAGTYSGGMQRRLDLAMTLVGDPRIIFLDEPTAGLDPRSRRAMWQLIRELVAGGVTIFLTTQYLEEADELADRVALLDRGKLVAEGTPDQLKRRIPGGHIRLQFAYADGLEAAARMLGETVRDNEALTLQVPSDGSVKSLRALLDRLEDAAIEVSELSIHTPDLDDVFLTLTGQPDKEREPVR
jgi:ABC-2 type transport system ATP-binding protein